MASQVWLRLASRRGAQLGLSSFAAATATLAGYSAYNGNGDSDVSNDSTHNASSVSALATAAATSLRLRDTAATAASAVLATTTTTSAEASSFDGNKIEFQVMAALETREELQKVRLAQVVNDLKKLADTKLKSANGKAGLRKYVTMAVDSISKKEKIQEEKEKILGEKPRIKGDNISLEGLDLNHLSSENAFKTIQALRNGGRLNKQSFMALVSSACRILQRQPTLINLRDDRIEAGKAPVKVTVVGDLHGSLSCLNTILDRVGPIDKFDENHVIVFNGDFVDRGQQSVEVLCTLLLLQLAHPDKVYLLRGNHEDHHVAAVYGFQDEVRLKYGSKQAEDLWEELRKLFAALPIAALAPLALILHGGLPSEEFQLEDLETMSPQARRSVETTVEPRTPEEDLLTDILWSDPSAGHEGIRPNPRGCGKSFGTDVTRAFLERNNLLFLVRGHEPVEEGVSHMDCGDERAVVTVFSNAAYPGGTGSNKGAIITLNPEDGSYDTQTFGHAKGDVIVRLQKRKSTLHALATIRSLISANRNRLERAFIKVQFFDGFVSVDEWAKVLSDILELQEMPWMGLHEPLAKRAMKGDLLEWRAFLDLNCLYFDEGLGSEQNEILHQNHEMLVTIFRYLDVGGKGEVGKDEFVLAVDILNKRLPEERRLNDPNALFITLDHDRSGSIDFEEFTKLFQYM